MATPPADRVPAGPPGVSTSERSPASSRRRWLLRGARLLGLVLVFAVAVLAVVFGEVLRERFLPWGYLAVFAITLLGSATILLPAPAAVSVGAFAAALQEPLLVGLVAATGQMFGEMTGYYVGWSGTGVAQNLRGYATVRRWMERRGGLTLFVLAALPNPFFDIGGIVAGATRFGVIRFAGVTWPGLALKNIGFAFAGLAGVELFGFFGG